MGLQSTQISSPQNWFDTNIDKLVIMLLPINWRKTRTVAFLQALLSPIKILHYNWKMNRLKNIYRVNHNFQKVYLENALNDEFDIQQRRIRVEEDIIAAYNYIYTFGEEKPRNLGIMHLYPHTSYSGSVDFRVNMNFASANEFDIRALVDFYKLFGTRYIIINNNSLNQNTP